MALAFGDDTAKRAGRLTLNPIAHIDPFGTILLPLILALSGAGMFGWAKPVPVNPARLRNPRQQTLLVSLAGPVTNVAIAVLAAAALRNHVFHGDLALRVVFAAGFINVILAAFNLLPIPPLDGSAVIERFIPAAWAPSWHRFRQYSFGILLLMVLVLPGALQNVFEHALRLWSRLL